jgi:DNA-binding protein H-NS
MIDTIDLSKYSMEDLKKLSEKIDKEMERQRKTSVLKARSRMEQIADELGLTVEEVLSFNKRKKAAKTSGKPKYRNPNDPDQTWTGRGKRPRWLQEALEKGAQLDDYLIGRNPSSAPCS